jgi:hypothetical protein
MTESDWAASDDPEAMLRWLLRRRRPSSGPAPARKLRPSARKLRLLLAACCRSCRGRKRGTLKALDVGERYADGAAGRDELRPAESDASRALASADGQPLPLFLAAWVADVTLSPTDVIGNVFARQYTDWTAPPHDRPAQARLVREVLGDPFWAVAVNPAWLTPTVGTLAQAAYEERALPSGELDAVRLSVLADALEDAGATGELVAHLRSAGPHVRGCWALDLVLGKQ